MAVLKGEQMGWRTRFAGVFALGKKRDEDGFGLVEVMVSAMVLAIFAMAFLVTLLGSVRGQILTRNRTMANQLATQKIEEARALSYDNLGLVSGNPAGTIVSPTTAAIGTVSYTVNTTVAYVDDPIANGFQTYANYKRVTVAISKSGVEYARLTTNVAPPTPPQLNKGVIKVMVIDIGNNTPVQGATVNITGGPSAPLSDTTSSDGQAIFPYLTPTPASGATAYYNVTVSYAGYQTLPNDVPNATAAHFTLSVSQVVTTTIRVFKPVTLTMNTVDAGGSPLNINGSFYVYSSRQAATVSFSNGTATITTLNGEAIIPGLQYEFGASSGSYFGIDQVASIPTGYPGTTAHTVNIVMQSVGGTAPLKITVKKGSTNQNNATVLISDGPNNIFLLGKTNSSGVFQINVPTSSTAQYTITYPPQSGNALVDKLTTVPGPSTTSVTVSV